MVTLKTNKGDIVVELAADKAPQTAENFIRYARDGFYNGTIFHRVIDGFMVQGGGFMAGMVEKQTRPPIKNEAANGLKNERGAIAMARTLDPHSATAQFFINVADNHSLNHTAPAGQGWGYCVFGKVIKGMDVVDAIRAVATTKRGGHQDVPTEDIVIESAAVADKP